MSLATYLKNHFVDKATFASVAGVSIERLDQLTAANAIPGATYTCDGVSVSSAVFGETPIEDSLTGEYFRPECVRWVRIADQAPAGSERTAVLAELVEELRSSLAAHGDTNEAIEAKIQGYLPYFF